MAKAVHASEIASSSPPRAIRLRLRVELIAVLALVVTTAVLSLSWIQMRGRIEQEREMQLEQLRAHARTIGSLMARAREREDQWNSHELAELLRIAPGWPAGGELVGAEVIVRSFGENLARVVSQGDVTVRPLPAGKPGEIDVQLADSDIYGVIEPIMSHRSGEEAYLRLWARISPVIPSGQVQEILALASIMGLLCLVLGGLLIELTVVRHLRRFQVATQKIAAGQWSTHLATTGPIELQELADNFNTMTQSLQRQREELLAQEGALHRNERLAAIGRLSAGVAHEIGNPLAALIGYADFLLDERSGLADATHRDILRCMGEQAHRMQEIVTRLLVHARHEGESLEEVSGQELWRYVAEDLEKIATQYGVRLETQFDSLIVAVDRIAWRQILINLVRNAARAVEGQEGGMVRLHLYQPTGNHDNLADDTVVLDVEDNGPGVDASIRSQLFEPFVTTQDIGKGTGLGLAVSRGLAEQMNASLTWVDTCEAGSTIFRLSFAGSQAEELRHAA